MSARARARPTTRAHHAKLQGERGRSVGVDCCPRRPGRWRPRGLIASRPRRDEQRLEGRYEARLAEETLQLGPGDMFFARAVRRKHQVPRP